MQFTCPSCNYAWSSFRSAHRCPQCNTDALTPVQGFTRATKRLAQDVKDNVEHRTNLARLRENIQRVRGYNQE